MEDKTMIIFTSNTCPKCMQVKHHLGRHLDSFLEANIRDRRNMQKLKELKIMSVPTLIYKGEVIIGFDPARLDEIIADLEQCEANFKGEK
jgi:glutaredoxin 3